MKITTILACSLLLAAPCVALDLENLVSPETLTTFGENLGFSPEQQTKLSQIYENARSEAAGLEEAVKREEEALNARLRAVTIDGDAAAADFGKLLAAESKLKQLQFKTLLALRSVLSAEQLAKAIALESKIRAENGPLKTAIEQKAERIRLAFDSLGVQPAPELVVEGERIRLHLRTGEFEKADAALDELGKKVGIDEAVDEAEIDFSRLSPGETELTVLEGRYRAVEAAAQRVIHLPTIRKLLQARDAIETAKTIEDASAVGRVLTWAEEALGLNPAP